MLRDQALVVAGHRLRSLKANSKCPRACPSWSLGGHVLRLLEARGQLRAA